MHGCWSGRGSSSSRSTLDRASSRVTWVVMAAASVFHTGGEEGKGSEDIQRPASTVIHLTLSRLLAENKGVRVH